MALPRSIQAQVAQADAILAAQQQAAQPTADLAALATEPAEELPAAPEPPAAPAAEPAAPPPQAPEPEAKWEHRYKSLQGRYNADVPALQKQVNALTEKLTEALAKVNEVANKPEPKTAEKPVADPKDVDAFGADLVDMVQRVAELRFGSAARQIEEMAADFSRRLTQLEQALQGTSQTVAVTAEQTFFDRLTKLVPNWEEVNADHAFLEWLGEEDPLIGGPRQVALNAAQQSLNVERAAAVFKAFLNLQPQAPKTDPVGKQVSPKATAATPTPTPQDKPILSQKQVQDFYLDVSKGKYRGKEKEAARIEAIINAAMAEGRIR